MYFIYAYICLLFSLSFSHVSSARAPPQFYFTLFHVTAAKKVPETCACFHFPACFQVQLAYFHIHVTFSFR
jgi:hypothetical protein